jgi:hypothetical protein
MSGTEDFIAYLAGQAVVLTLGILGYLSSRKGVRGVKDDVAVVHDLVNAHSDSQDRRIEQITQTLTGAGVAVPPTPDTAPAEPPPEN